MLPYIDFEPLLLLLGGLFAALLARSWYRVLRRTKRVTGSVSSVLGSTTKRRRAGRGAGTYSTSCTATITFTVDGATHQFDFSFPSGQEQLRRDQAVPVLFDPADPRNASVDRGRANYTEVGFATLVFTAAALLHLVGC